MRKRILTTLFILVVAALTFGALRLHKLAFIGSGYAAQQTCACLFISNRPLESCRTDLDPLAQRLVTITPTATTVHAHSILSSATATYSAPFGCSLDN